MSEYTNYFAVQSSSEHDVQNTLNAAKVKSVVDADKSDYYFSAQYKRNGICNWITVSAPANSHFDSGQFYHEDQFDRIGSIFDIIIHFFKKKIVLDGV